MSVSGIIIKQLAELCYNCKPSDHPANYLHSSRSSSAPRLWRIPSCPPSRRHLPIRSSADPPGRRSANYKPPYWDFNFIQSSATEFTEETHSKMATELMERAKKMLVVEEETEGVAQLELIDDLQMLGLWYHFQDEINQILESIYSERNKNLEESDLYSTALAFRLLRGHGFKVSQEVFDRFDKGNGGFSGDTRGLLQLHEASFMLTQGETTLEMARDFSASFLQKRLDGDEIEDEYLTLMARQSLEFPIHWRIQRPYARWFMDVYGKRPNMKSAVLELARLDFNIVQAAHQHELKRVSKWWKQTRLAEKLPFARDRVVESYLLTMGLFEPEYAYSRTIGTKVNALVTIIDDVFDVYGTMEELLLFNNAIQRWDDEAVEQLPEYMQMCFQALDNFINEMADDALNQHGLQITPYLRKSWVDLCATYMQEAKWYSEGYTPRLQEYIDNACISISVPVMLAHAFFALPIPIDKEVADACFNTYHNIARYSGTIARLANDLGTSPDEMKRGDVPKSVQCYMSERGGGRIDIQEAQEHVRSMMSEAWKKMNGEILDSPLPKSFVRCAFEFGRVAHYVYQDEEDGHGIQNSRVKDRISALLFHPIV